jgi:hypothetical protein
MEGTLARRIAALEAKDQGDFNMRVIAATHLTAALTKAFEEEKVPVPRDLRGRDYAAVLKLMENLLVARVTYQKTKGR